MPCTQRLRELLDSHASKYVVVTHSRAFTAQEIAASLHVPGRELAKSVVVRTPRGLALAVVRAQDHVDLARVGQELGRPVRLASETEIAGAFPDCEVGAMPPFGSLYDMPTLADHELTKDTEIVFNAGTHTTAVRLPWIEYASIEHPRVLPLTLRIGHLVG